jgi:hypothetical protein
MSLLISDANLTHSILQVSIPLFQDKYFNNKNETFYSIHILNLYTKKTWDLEKRYQEFIDLRSELSETIPKVPEISKGFNLFKSSNSYDTLKQRQYELQEFLSECLSRKDIISNEIFMEFLEINTQFPDLIRNKPEFINDIEFQNISCEHIIYLEKESIILFACNDLNFTSRMDAYLSNAADNLPWKKESKGNEKEKELDKKGRVSAFFTFKLINYLQIKTNKKKIKFEKLFEKNFNEIISSIYYDENSQTLSIGLISGKINLFRKYEESEFKQFDFMTELNYHNASVTGIIFDSLSGNIYTCSEDKNIFASEISKIYNKNNNPKLVNESNYSYCKMIFEKKYERFFVSNNNGHIEVYLTDTFPPMFVNDIKTSSEGYIINDFTIDYVKYYLFACCSNGNICVIDLASPGKEKLGKEISHFNYFDAKINLTSLIYIKSMGQIITSDNKGRLIFWSLKKGKPLFLFNYKKCEIIKLINFYNEELESNIVLIGSDDMNLSIIKLPDKLVNNEEIEKYEENEIKNISDMNAMIALQKYDENYNSDEDSLNGWDYFANYINEGK